MCVKPAQVAFDHAPHGGILQIAEAIGLGRALGFEVLAPGDQLRQADLLGTGLGGGFGREDRAVIGQDPRIDGIGLGQKALATGKGSHPSRVELANGHLGLPAGAQERVFATSGRLADHMDRGAREQQSAQPDGDGFGVIVESGRQLQAGAEKLQVIFGHIDSDEFDASFIHDLLFLVLRADGGRMRPLSLWQLFELENQRAPAAKLPSDSPQGGRKGPIGLPVPTRWPSGPLLLP